ncbi:hypothetical protein [Burkholderia contaminans]|uniref:hypothetical protein n=1 Tax=Burkholderia contaminans TaxID=488447 RepID=UPI003F68B57A
MPTAPAPCGTSCRRIDPATTAETFRSTNRLRKRSTATIANAGIPRIIVKGLTLQRALRDDADLQYHRLGLEPIRPGDLADPRLSPATF